MLADRIRQEIAAAHLRIEQTEFAQKMASGTMTRELYAQGLAHLYTLHAGLEEQFAKVAAENPHFAAIYSAETMNRQDAIRRDLEVLQPELPTATHPVTERFVDQVRHWSEQNSSALLGVLYVIEGSRMGSMVLTRTLAKAFQLDPRPGVGLDYHLDGIATRVPQWQKFKAQLQALPLCPEEADAVCQAAVVTMDTLVELYSALSMHQESLQTAAAQ